MELKLLATLIAHPESLDDAELVPGEFSDPVAAKIFKLILHRTEQGKLIDPYTMMEAMNGKVETEIIVTVCDRTIAEPWAVKEYTSLIKDRAARSRLKQVATRIMEVTETADRIDDDVMAGIEKTLLDIGSSFVTGTQLEHISEIVQRNFERLQRRYTRRGELTGIDTGFERLNQMTGGWQPGDLNIVAARPSIGKTAFALQSALSASEKDYAAIFSIEMGEDSLADRLMANTGYVQLYSLRTGMIPDEDWPKITMSVGVLENKNMFIDTNPNATVPYMRSRLRRLLKNIPEGRRLIVFVDYLQLIRDSSGVKGRSRYEIVSEVSRELKSLAKELNAPVIALAQLNREVGKRKDKRPDLSDIRESGQIEQDADIVALLHRDDYYNPESERKGIMDIIVAKNRNGETDTLPVVFRKDTQRLLDPEQLEPAR